MKRTAPLIALACLVLSLAACTSYPELRYTPEEYAKLRGIELITTPPTRPYELVANVQGHGGQHTTTATMINGMIDEALKAGARALVPMEFAGEGRHAGQARPVTGLELFVHTENGRTVTKGRAILWTGN